MHSLGSESQGGAASPWAVVVGQRRFLALVGVVAVLRFIVPPGRIPGAVETWATVLGFWALSIVWVAWTPGDRRPLGERVGDIGAHNLGIQLLIAVPSILVGLARMISDAPNAAPAFPVNALVTVFVLPLASLTLLTFAALPLVWLFQRMRALVMASVLLAFAWPALAHAQSCSSSDSNLGLDHVVVAVSDLPRAAQWFETELGFTIKSGRRHANGIENVHAKFVDGTEVELLSVGPPSDALTANYARFLQDGPGAAYLAFRGPELDPAAARRLDPAAMFTPGTAFRWIAFPPEHDWHQFFLIEMARPVTDAPDLLEHDNGAMGLAAVWVVASDNAAEERFLSSFGALPCGEAIVGDRTGGRVALANGEVVLVEDGSDRLRGDRRIVGFTVRVRVLDVALAGIDPDLSGPIQHDARGRAAVVQSPGFIGVQVEFLEIGR